jgi:hypothetical protein
MERVRVRVRVRGGRVRLRERGEELCVLEARVERKGSK